MTEETSRQRYVRLLKELELAGAERHFSVYSGTSVEDVRAIHAMIKEGLVDGVPRCGTQNEPTDAFNVTILILGQLRLSEWSDGPPPKKSKLVSGFILAGKIATAAAAIWGGYKLVSAMLS